MVTVRFWVGIARPCNMILPFRISASAPKYFSTMRIARQRAGGGSSGFGDGASMSSCLREKSSESEVKLAKAANPKAAAIMLMGIVWAALLDRSEEHTSELQSP